MNIRAGLASLTLGTCLAACATAPAPTPADRVFTGGAVYTVNPEQPWATAVAIRDGRIIYVGDEDGARTWVGPGTDVTDLAGRMLLPGFHDSHMHPMAAGTRFVRCQLKGLEWPDAVIDEIARCAAALAPGEWLRAVDLDDNALDGDGPDISVLDQATADHPALLQSTENRFLVNTLALRAAGFTADTLDPEHGRIGRVAGSREPNGVLEGSAAGEVYGLLPPYGPEILAGALDYASGLAHCFGITSSNESSTNADHVAAYIAAEQSGDLDLRVQASLSWNADRGLEQIDDLERLRDQAGDDGRFSARSVKFFLDGDGVQRSGALLAPYVGTPDERGILQYSDKELRSHVTALDAAGFDLHFHAWGDAAVRQALDALEYAIGRNPAWDRRHQVAHLALVHPDDLPRFAALGVTADVHPIWAWLNRERRREVELLEPERVARLIPIASLYEAGARVVAGSDWISMSMNPLDSIQYALTRRPLDGSGPAWNPHEAASLEQMIEAYTINGAWLARQEDQTGSIEAGKAADLVVLDRNLFETDPMEIAQVRVLLTLLEGREVFREESFR